MNMYAYILTHTHTHTQTHTMDNACYRIHEVATTCTTTVIVNWLES